MKVVILGGGFCGALAAKRFDRRKDVELVLVTKRDFFEYTPSVHKLLTEPGYAKRIRVPYRNFLKRATIVTDTLLQVMPDYVETESGRIPFDYLIVSTGIDYPVRLENKKGVFPVSSGEWALKAAKPLSEAKHVLVVGGGLIGAEVAGEIATKCPEKRLTVIHPPDRLLERNPPKASAFAKRFLEKRRADIRFGEKVVEQKDDRFITDKGRELHADIAFWCAGIRINPWFMKGFPDSVFTERKALRVNDYLQLDGFPNIFVGGDINSVPEEKTAHNAERHARLMVKNILALAQGKKRKAYKPHSSPLLISLGDTCSLLTFKKWSFAGRIPAFMKDMVEWMVMRRYR